MLAECVISCWIFKIQKPVNHSKMVV